MANSLVFGGWQYGKFAYRLPDQGKKIYAYGDATLTCDSTAADPEVFDAITFPGGLLMRVYTRPGATAPTDASDLLLYNDEFGSGYDEFGGRGVDKVDATSTLGFQPVPADESSPIWLAPGDYKPVIVGNAVNSAIVYVRFVLLEGI